MNGPHEEWRDIAVDRLTLTLCVLAGVGLPFILLELGTALGAMGVASVVGWTALLTSVVFRRRLSLTTRALILLAVLFLSFTVGFAVAGALVGPVLSGALLVTVGGLIFGRSAGFAALGLCVVTLLAMGTLVSLDVLPPPSPQGAALTDFSGWAREAVAFTLFVALLAVTTAFVVRRIERSLAETSEALARVSAEQQEREQAQADLQAAQREVVELQRIEALGRLAGGVAHDFNNSLLVLLGGLEMLAEDTRDPKNTALIADMQHAAQGASQLTAQLLAFGRRDVVRASRIDTAELIRDSARSLRRVLPDNIELGLEIDDPPAIVADRSQLDQILLNLAINARDAMPDGGRITLSARRGETQTGLAAALIGIGDSGTGIDPAARDLIFEPFFTTKPPGQGTGLGLSMVHGIMQRLGGTIDVISEAGVGTTFTLRIPTEPAESSEPVPAQPAPPQPAEPVASEPAAAARPDGPRRTVLVAEDEDLVRRIIVAALVRAGLHVIEASNTAEALRHIAVHDGTIDLLCTDGLMPGGSCKELIDGYRERYPANPILVCSGHLQEDLSRRDVATGQVAFLQKPFRGAQLVSRVTELLDAP